mgnify:CR=1 FL=1
MTKYYIYSVKYGYNVQQILSQYPARLFDSKIAEIKTEIENGYKIEYRLTVTANDEQLYLLCQEIHEDIIIRYGTEAPELIIYDDYMD